MKQRPADWMAWSLQFLLGAGVFVFLGLRFISEGLPVQQATSVTLALILLSFALVGGGIASRWGDRFWVGDEYRVIPPDGIDHNRLSRFLSHLSMASGLILLAVALFGGR